METLRLNIKYRKNIIGFMGPRTFSVVKVDPAVCKERYGLNLASVL